MRLWLLISVRSGLDTSSAYGLLYGPPDAKICGDRREQIPSSVAGSGNRLDSLNNCHTSWAALSGFSLHQFFGLGADGLGQLQFLEFGLNSDRVLSFGNDLLTGDHTRKIFLN